MPSERGVSARILAPGLRGERRFLRGVHNVHSWAVEHTPSRPARRRGRRAPLDLLLLWPRRPDKRLEEHDGVRLEPLLRERRGRPRRVHPRGGRRDPSSSVGGRVGLVRRGLGLRAHLQFWASSSAGIATCAPPRMGVWRPGRAVRPHCRCKTCTSMQAGASGRRRGPGSRDGKPRHATC